MQRQASSVPWAELCMVAVMALWLGYAYWPADLAILWAPLLFLALSAKLWLPVLIGYILFKFFVQLISRD